MKSEREKTSAGNWGSINTSDLTWFVTSQPFGKPIDKKNWRGSHVWAVHSPVNSTLWHILLAAYRLQQLRQSVNVTQPIVVDIEDYWASEGPAWWKKLMEKKKSAAWSPHRSTPRTTLCTKEKLSLGRFPNKIVDKEQKSTRPGSSRAAAFCGDWTFWKWECTMSDICLHLVKWKCHYVSAPATAGCGPFVNDSWLKWQLQGHITIRS